MELKEIFADIGLTPEQQQIVWERAAKLLLADKEQAEIVTKIAEWLIQKSTAQEGRDKRKTIAPPDKILFATHATLTAVIGNETITEEGCTIRVYNDGRVAAINKNGLIITHLQNALIRQPPQQSVREKRIEAGQLELKAG